MFHYNHCRRRKNHGGTLPEVMMALFSGIIMLLACFSTLMTTSQNMDGAKQNVLAYQAARHILENMRSFGSDAIATGTYGGTSFGTVSEMTEMNGATSSVSVTAPRGILKQVRITVRWKTGGRGTSRISTLVAYIAPNGVAP